MITPGDTPSSPQHYAEVAVTQQNIEAPLSDGEITAAFGKANAEGGNGVLYPMSPRIADTKTMMESPAGFGSDGYDIFGGYHQGGGDGWPSDVEPDVAGP